MAMLIKEKFNTKGLEVQWINNKVSSIKENLTQTILDIDPDSIMVEIEGIHEYPFATRNFTRYHNLKNSIPSWTKPYCRPVIMHHNEDNGKIIGRILSSEYVTKDTLSGTPALSFTANIPDKEGIQQIKDKRLLTTSIGALAYDCRCSICGHNIAQNGECEHTRGEVYDGEICYWDFYDIEGKELSYVIVPSDKFSQNRKIYSPKRIVNTRENHLKGACFSMNENKDSTKEMLIGEEVTQNVDTPIKTITSDINPNNNDETDNKQQNNTLSEMDNLKIKTTELETELNSVKQEKEKMKQELDNVNILLTSAQTKLKNAQDSLSINHTSLVEEIKAREKLETILENKNKQIKESLIENINLYRSNLKKPVITTEKLTNRTLDSLNDAIADLKEESKTTGTGLSVKESLQVENPGFSKEKEKNKSNNVKEENNVSNINLKECVYNMFDNIIKGN